MSAQVGQQFVRRPPGARRDTASKISPDSGAALETGVCRRTVTGVPAGKLTTGCSSGMGSPPTFDVAAFCASPVTCAIWDLLAASREQEQSQRQ